MPHPLDAANMEGVILRSPSQLTAGLAAPAEGPLPAGRFQRVVLAGMGGSWMAGALVRDVQLARAPILIHRSYELPTDLPTEGTLVVVSTYSGDTEETLSAYEAARARGLPLVGITRGGRLAAWCRRDGVPLVCIPADPPTMQPRCATGYMVGILVRLLERLGLADVDAAARITALAQRLNQFMPIARQRGTELAAKLVSATPIVYASPPYATVARIIKIKFNENSKIPAFWNVFPELNHNEMIGWTMPRGQYQFVMLRDAAERPRILRRMDLMAELLGELGLPSHVVPIEGQTDLEKLFTTLLVGDWASYELALLLGVDPSPVELVQRFKRLLE
jgi:glucose/mannose-6-phosphate isomerase